jgi:glutamate synthase domain-containing protein 2
MDMIYIIGGIGALLLVIAIYDRLQTKHTIWRKYPLVGRLRWVMEDLRPKIQQYFVEDDINGKPIPKYQRDIIYQRSKGDNEKIPFGTELDLYQEGSVWINHSNYPLKPEEFKNESLRVTIGENTCGNPYSASILNISAMSYGSLNKNAISSLAIGSKEGKFALNTGEGGISEYHLKANDLIWQIGTGYFGCRNEEGRFDIDQFSLNASRKQVKMIEIKISQGAKPGHGGILPAKKNTKEIAEIRGVKPGTVVISPSGHTAFKNANQLIGFISRLRSVCDKPVGIKLCIGSKVEFGQMVKAMINSNIYPDFITIDGAEGGTGAAPLEFTNSTGMPLLDALTYVHNTLVSNNIREKIKIIASGKVVNAFDIAKVLALGADMVNMARPFMISMGCIQARQCHNGNCPAVIATHKKAHLLNVDDKSKRVARFHKATIHNLTDLLRAARINRVDKIRPTHISIRKDGEIKTLKDAYRVK